MSIENFKVKMMWTCDTCDKTIQRSSKSAHLKSKAHQKKAGNTPNKECDLCCTASFDFKHCTQCVNSWCVDCHKKIDKCPFCRTKINGAPPRPVQWELGPEFLPEPEFFEHNFPIRRSRQEPQDIFIEFWNRIHRMETHLNWINTVVAEDWY